MKTVTTVAELRRELAARRRGSQSIGLVPTMGALHEGHLSLLRRARERNDVVVMSLFVNPTQFNDSGDLAAYPRDERRDAELAAAEGVDVVFMPSVAEMYPAGFATTISVSSITGRLECAHRGSAHFDAVATVVAKLLNAVGPDVAYFGQKDAQQAIVIRRMVRDLNLAVEIEVCPTVRADDGLALSSRNALLSAADRERAAYLHRALAAIRAAVQAGESDPEAARAAGLAELEAAGIEPDYLELVAADTLDPVPVVNGEVLALVAARVGPARLIDNDLIRRGDPR